jgi:hypothetical protein
LELAIIEPLVVSDSADFVLRAAQACCVEVAQARLVEVAQAYRVEEEELQAFGEQIGR